MVRKNIFELLAEQYDVVKEMNKIARLFSLVQIQATNPLNFQLTQYSIEGVFEAYCFVSWKQRGAYINCTEMKADLNLPQEYSQDIEDMLKGLEYYINILNSLKYKLNIPGNINFLCSPAYAMLLQNIDILLEHINYETLESVEEEKVILIPNNPAATAVAEIAPKEIAFAILKYNHASLKGQLEEKRKLLVSIANEYEPLLDKPVEGFKDYFAKTTGLLNNLNIRHNNKAGKNKNEIVAKMSPEELESWYDELYQLLLFCVLCKDNYERKGKVSELLKNLKTELKAK